MRLRPINDDHG